MGQPDPCLVLGEISAIGLLLGAVGMVARPLQARDLQKECPAHV